MSPAQGCRNLARPCGFVSPLFDGGDRDLHIGRGGRLLYVFQLALETSHRGRTHFAAPSALDKERGKPPGSIQVQG
jgi:hypothetical protein